MTETTIRKSIFIAASRDTVWDYLTKAEQLGQWFHPAKSDLAKDQDFTLVSQKDGERMCWGRVTQMRAPVFMRWDFTVGPMQGAMSVVEWTLDEAPGGTRLSLDHSGLPSDTDGFGLVLALDKGWHGFLGKMQSLQM